jgi:hypothetical protein
MTTKRQRKNVVHFRDIVLIKRMYRAAGIKRLPTRHTLAAMGICRKVGRGEYLVLKGRK